jgi:hypothetical protein
LEGIRTRKDTSTSCPRWRRFVCLIGRGCTGDVVIAPMKQVSLLACAAALCCGEVRRVHCVNRMRPLVSTETRGRAMLTCLS